MKFSNLTGKNSLTNEYYLLTNNKDYIQKLGELEDITDSPLESLIMLFKALKQRKVFCKDDDGFVQVDTIDYIEFYDGHLEFENSIGDFYVSDYGNTWWLTDKEIPKNDN